MLPLGSTGQRRPLAPGAENVHQAVDDVAFDDRALVAAALGRRDQRRNQAPLFVRQIARVTQLAAVVSSPIFVCPHATVSRESLSEH